MTIHASHRPIEAARALAAAVGLVLLLTGLSVLLTTATAALDLPELHWPTLRTTPAAAPTEEQLSTWFGHTWQTLRLSLTTPELAVLVALGGGWTTWAVLTWWSLSELTGQLVHGLDRARRHAVASPPRRWIAGLVATALSLTAPAAAQATPHTPPAATAPRHPGNPPDIDADALTSGGHPDPPASGEAASTTPIRYTVRQGDTLWELAARLLGNGHRYPEIVHLNTSRLPNPHLLHPGDVLLIPRSAPDAAATESTDFRTVTVTHGDTLAGIAARTLDDPDQWHTLFRLNVGRPQPDGLSLADPDILLPGWHLLIPEAPQPPAPQRPDRNTSPPPDTPTPPPTEQPVPTSSPPEASDTTENSTRTGGIDLGPGVFLGLGLAAATSTALLLARARHRRRHRPGAPPPTDLAVAPTVYQLRQAHLHATHPEPDTEQISIPALHQPPQPSTPPEAPEPELGVDEDETVTLDLLATGGLGLTGPGSSGAARALLLSMLTSEPAATVVLTHAAAEDLLLETVRWPSTVRLTGDLDEALILLEADLADRNHEQQITQAPCVLVTSTADEHTDRLTDLLHRAQPHNIGAILLSPWQAGTTLTVDSDGTVTDTTNTDLAGIRLFTTTAAAAHELLDLLTPETPEAPPSSEDALETQQHHEEPDAHPRNTEDIPEDTDTSEPCDDDQTEVAPPPLSLRILGPTRLTWRPQPDHDEQDLTTALTPRQRELLVYLALHPDGVARATLITELWHDHPPNRPTNALNTTLTRLRSALTRAIDHTLAEVVDNTDGRLRLAPGLVTVDYWCFETAHQASRSTTDTSQRLARLRETVETYQGELGADIDAEWIQTPRYAAQRTLVNAAGELARHLVDDDPQHTLDLLETARRFDPYNEHLYRDIMRLQSRLNTPDAVARTLNLLHTRLAEIDTTPTTETHELATGLQNRAEHHSVEHSGK